MSSIMPCSEAAIIFLCESRVMSNHTQESCYDVCENLKRLDNKDKSKPAQTDEPVGGFGVGRHVVLGVV